MSFRNYTSPIPNLEMQLDRLLALNFSMKRDEKTLDTGCSCAPFTIYHTPLSAIPRFGRTCCRDGLIRAETAMNLRKILPLGGCHAQRHARRTTHALAAVSRTSCFLCMDNRKSSIFSKTRFGCGYSQTSMSVIWSIELKNSTTENLE